MAHDLRYSLFANIHAHCSLSTLPIRPPAALHPSLGVHPLTQASWLVGKLLCKITADLFIVMAPITNTYDCRVLFKNKGCHGKSLAVWFGSKRYPLGSYSSPI